MGLCAQNALSKLERKTIISQKGRINERELKGLIEENKEISFEKPITLDLPYSQCTKKEFLNYISRFSNLTGINLSFKRDKQGFRVNSYELGGWLDALNDLKIINLSGNRFEVKPLQNLLKRCSNVDELILDYYPNIAEELLLGKEAHKLRVLSSYHSHLKIKLDWILKDNLPNLEKLRLGYFSTDLTWITKCTNLTELTLSSEDPSDVQSLTVLTKLKKLDLFGVEKMQNGKSLQKLINLESISLPACFANIDDSLPSWKNLKRICSYLPCKEIAKIESLEVIIGCGFSIADLYHLKELKYLIRLEVSSVYNDLDPNEVFDILPQLQIFKTQTFYERSKDSPLTNLTKIIEWGKQLISLDPWLHLKRSVIVKTHQNPKKNSRLSPQEEQPGCTIS